MPKTKQKYLETLTKTLQTWLKVKLNYLPWLQHHDFRRYCKGGTHTFSKKSISHLNTLC